MSEAEEGAEDVSWWDDRVDIAQQASGVLRFEQAEFWGEPKGEPLRALADPAADAETVSPGLQEIECESARPEPGSTANVFTIAKFLRISRALYDGRDKSRWLLLPRRRNEARYPLMAGPGPCPGGVKELRLSPRGPTGGAL